jgi:mannitol-1-phosphate 5-dehydrogenase
MQQSADILIQKYPGDFSKAELDEHIDDLLNRFRNKALGDTIFRIGCDLKRKLHRNDRILGPLLDGIKLNLPLICYCKRLPTLFVLGQWMKTTTCFQVM